MRITLLTPGNADNKALRDEYASARAFGTFRVGSRHLFFRAGLKLCAAAYDGLTRCYRRVMLVPAQLCCGSGDLEIDCLVLEDERKELAQIQMPGRKAAVAALECIAKAHPTLQTRCPQKPNKEELA